MALDAIQQENVQTYVRNVLGELFSAKTFAGLEKVLTKIHKAFEYASYTAEEIARSEKKDPCNILLAGLHEAARNPSVMLGSTASAPELAKELKEAMVIETSNQVKEKARQLDQAGRGGVTCWHPRRIIADLKLKDLVVDGDNTTIAYKGRAVVPVTAISGGGTVVAGTAAPVPSSGLPR